MSYNGLWNHPISNQSTTLAQAQQQQQQQQQTLRQSSPNSFSATGATIIGNGQHEPVDHGIYSRAIAISEPRVLSNDNEHLQQQIKQKVLRRVEVPFTRQVKVPTQTTQLVPTMIEQKVPVRKLVEVQGYKTVQEPYTVFEEREAIRNKEIWVKKVVPERYIEKVAVQKIRTVQKPTTLIKEVQTYETVQVPTTKAVAVQGYRVDEVQDSKLVEVEETQDYETRLHPVGEPEINATRDLGRIPGAHLSRTVGQDVFTNDHPQLRDVDQDSVVAPQGQLRGSTYAEPLTTLGGQGQTQGGSYYRNSLSPSNQRTQPLLSPARNSYGTSQQQQPHHDEQAPAGSFHKLAQAGDHSRDSLLASLKPLGLSVDDTHTRHTDGTGVLITRVDRGLPAARAGIQAFDILTSVANRPTSTVDELCQVLSRVNGPLQVTLNRDGRRNIVVTLHK